VVLDEAQKIKSPGTRVTSAVKGLNAAFFVAMTGTPVENRLSDLWCIADAVQPSALGDLKSFSARFEKEGSDVRALRDQVWHEEAQADGAPKLVLRRLKSEKLPGLPSKIEHALQRPMPPRQLDAYMRAVQQQGMQGEGAMLELIHNLRRVSLHPMLVDGGLARGEVLDPADSARMQVMIEVLDKVAARDEKALVFLESLDLQDAAQIPTLLQRRYGLKRLPMIINGEVGTTQRQERVDLFQQEQGFDVMLLSPKAGGVGLTLTAANHVIHLSRWWNPAVEDQCSDRVYRIGQRKDVHVYYPMAVLPEAADSSFDVQLQKLMERKRDLARNLLAPPAFSKQDYAEMRAGLFAG
jgi:SNF2 family DNA or RNA helicase